MILNYEVVEIVEEMKEEEKERVITRLALKPDTTREQVLACLKNSFGVDDSMYELLNEYEVIIIMSIVDITLCRCIHNK